MSLFQGVLGQSALFAQPVEDQAVTVERLFFKEAGDAAHGGGAGTGGGGDVAVGTFALGQHAGDHPAFGQGLDFSRGAQIDQEAAAFGLILQKKEGFAEFGEAVRVLGIVHAHKRSSSTSGQKLLHLRLS